MSTDFPFLLPGKSLKITDRDDSLPLYLPIESVFSQKNQLHEDVLPLSFSTSEPVVTPQVSYSDAKIAEIPVDQIIANPYQPRKIFDERALRELSESIRVHGVIQPLVVTKVAGGYELVVGERRFRASQLAGRRTVPAIVKETMADQTKLEVALIENIQRQELNPIEEALAYQQLMTKFNLTQGELSQKVGKSRSTIANTLRLLHLPKDVQQAVVDGKISEGHARSLLPLQSQDNISQMYRMIQDQNLNVRQIENKVKEFGFKKRVDAVSQPDPSMMSLETTLRGQLGAPVKIQRVGTGGRITIEFFNDEELQVIVNHMLEQRRLRAQEPEVYSEGLDTDGYLTV